MEKFKRFKTSMCQNVAKEILLTASKQKLKATLKIALKEGKQKKMG